MVLAIILSVILFPLGAVAAIPVSLWKYRDASFKQFWSDLFYAVAITIDMLGCVILAPLMNVTCITGGGYKFGVVGETISQAIAVNYYDGTLTTFGLRIMHIIEFFDPGHTRKAYESWIEGVYEQ